MTESISMNHTMIEVIPMPWVVLANDGEKVYAVARFISHEYAQDYARSFFNLNDMSGVTVVEVKKE